ncbi:CDP-glycerol glycerophosphotransferase family protein [Rubrivivax sp. JA1024]|nr:CDP-glycerol glycerophosphotransferase family protein [Rubrivivax sp. JA1024]
MNSNDELAAALAALPDESASLAFWRDPSSYDALLKGMLEQLAGVSGELPSELQLALLQRLHWYFTIDGRERAPTVCVDEALASRFHTQMRALMARLAPDSLVAFSGASPEVRHALLSYRMPTLAATPAVDAYDHRQGLARVSYWVHGTPPGECLRVDGRDVLPVHAKWRGCNYFRRRLLRQRILWVDLAGARSLQLELDGRPVHLGLGPQPFSAHPAATATATAGEELPARVRACFASGKGGQEPLPPGWQGWKVRLLKSFARSAPVRRLYGRGWVFIDREENADDSAEHLYRWLRTHRPDVPAWFLLRPDSPDWPRLQAEGFRLLPPGLRRKLVVLGAEHIVSSHAEWVFGGFDRRLFGDAMQWRYTFLQHGVTMNDVSHWLGPREFDCFVTSSPAEHASIVGDDSAYPYTEREVRRTGMPRHDRLLRLARELPADAPRCLLIMPTWRASLLEGPDPRRVFSDSDFARCWRSVLCDEGLRARARAAGLKIVFLPHRNLLPFLDLLGLPEDVELASAANGGFQPLLVRAAAFVTDYTSVSFDAALLRRPVFYYHFDRAAFYEGGHNWRPGYFDYERDGFGPIAEDAEALLAELGAFIDSGCRVPQEYLLRMERAMPDRDGRACRRVYEAMLSLDQPGARIVDQLRAST